MRHLLSRILTAAALVAAPVAATTLPAVTLSVAPAPATTLAAARFGPAQHALAAHSPGFNINGYNWGGYVATGSGFSSVSATWTEPSAKCNSVNDLYAPWVGIDGYGSSTVEQTGVATDCSSGSPFYQAWYEMYPRSPVYLSATSYPVSPGNSITASVTYAGSRRYTLKLVNNSRGWTFTTTQSISARRVSAEVIIESPTGAYPNFGTISFTGATVNGSTLASYHPVALDPSANGVYEAHTNSLSGGNFTMTYLHE
jgi:hypothetical protein